MLRRFVEEQCAPVGGNCDRESRQRRREGVREREEGRKGGRE